MKRGGWPSRVTPNDVCGVFGPYGVGGSCKLYGGTSDKDEVACRTDILIPFGGIDEYLNDFDTGTVQEIGELWFVFSHLVQIFSKSLIISLQLLYFSHPTEFLDSTFHPHHQHVNSFQLYNIGPIRPPIQPEVTNYYQVGEWHATIQYPALGETAGVDITFRFQVDIFTGHMIQHCHLLFHEDGKRITFV